MGYRTLRSFPVRLNDGTLRWFFPFYDDNGVIRWKWPYKQPNPNDGGGGGDDGSPEWVPEGSSGHLDFANNQAWTEGEGVVTSSSLVGTDNTDNLMGPSEFVSANVDLDGYHFVDAGSGVPCLAFIGELKTAILAGSTVVILWATQQELASNENEHLLVVGLEDGSGAVSVDVQADPGVSRLVNFYSWNGDFALVAGDSNSGADALNCVAFTLTSARGEISLNGQAAEVGTLLEVDWPVSGYEVVLMRLADGSVIRSITIFPPIADETGLPALSTLP